MTDHSPAPRTLLAKLWDRHVVAPAGGQGAMLLYVDRQLVYEVTSPQAFEGLRQAGRRPWRPETVLATADHNVPTRGPARPHHPHQVRAVRVVRDPLARRQVEKLSANCRQFGLLEFGLADPRQGIIHVVAPEQGAILPGMLVVAGDSHTSTHGAFAALALGVGSSEVEHVLATQCLALAPMPCLRVWLEGAPRPGVCAKDMALAVIGLLGTAGATGQAIEFAGPAVRALSMEGRMTLCNLAIEAGARVGLVGVDDATLDYLRGRPFRAPGRAVGPRRGGLAHAGERPRRGVPARAARGRGGAAAHAHLGHLAGDGAAHRWPRARPGP